MAEEQQEDFTSQLLADFNTKLKDMEERQKLIKERVLLIGENLVNERESNIEEISEIKTKVERLEHDFERMKETISSLIDETQNFARKNEVESLRHQFKIFEPLTKRKS